MAARRRLLLVIPLLCMGLALTGCESFDPAYLFPDTKKKLPGERREVFPQGIPGVTQGIPPEMVKGNPAQQAAENPAPVQQVATPAAQEKPKAPPRPKKQTVSRPAQDEPQQRTAPSSSGNWPAPQPGQVQRPPQAAQQQPPAGSAWPAPPASGTFTR